METPEQAIESQRREDGTFRCTKVTRIPLYRTEQVAAVPLGTAPMQVLGKADLRCIHAQGHRGAHLAYHGVLRVAWSGND